MYNEFMKYKNYLFDWDGSLGDSLPLWFSNFKSLFAEFGVEVTYKDIAEKIIGNWNGPAEFGVDNEEFFKRLEEKVLDKLVEIKLNAGARELMEKIKAEGGKIGILTSSKRVWVEPALRRLGVWEMVDVFLGKEDVSKYKPDPEIILKALEKLDGTKEETVMMGDSVNDIEAARRAGVDGVLYYPQRYREFYSEEFQKSFHPARVIEDFREMKGQLV